MVYLTNCSNQKFSYSLIFHMYSCIIFYIFSFFIWLHGALSQSGIHSLFLIRPLLFHVLLHFSISPNRFRFSARIAINFVIETRGKSIVLADFRSRKTKTINFYFDTSILRQFSFSLYLFFFSLFAILFMMSRGFF